jgi:hypothetical protein
VPDDLLIVPGNPYDFDADDLESLRAELEEEFKGLKVAVAPPPVRGYGVTLHEVISVWNVAVDVAGDFTTLSTAVGGPIALIVAWMRRRARREREEHPNAPPRPRSVELLGRDGEVIKTVVIDDPDKDPRIEEGGGKRRIRPSSD